MHTFRLHHNCKIDTSRFEEGKRPSHRCDLRSVDVPAWCVDTARLAGSRREEVLRWSEDEAADSAAEPSLGFVIVSHHFRRKSMRDLRISRGTVADLCLSRAGHPTIMFLLMPHRNSRQMRVVRSDAKANKRKVADTFLLASLSCVALPQRQLRGYFLNAGAKVRQDHKQLLISY